MSTVILGGPILLNCVVAPLVPYQGMIFVNHFLESACSRLLQATSSDM